MDLVLTCIGLLGLLVFGLGLGVSLQRGRSSRSIGYDEDPTDSLHKWCRAHANACEFAPMFAVLIYALGNGGYGSWLGFLFMAAVAVRYAHAAGMILSPTLAKGHPLRFAGALGTYVVGILLALAAVF
jgi:uncharacterized membrane protein YecN with MAPEG domain